MFLPRNQHLQAVGSDFTAEEDFLYSAVFLKIQHTKKKIGRSKAYV